jgi:tetratricopeptide (TPR) repeat protein
MMQPLRSCALALALLAALSCSSTSNRAVEEDMKRGDYDAASKKLEQRSAEDPDDFEGHIQTGQEYYQLARRAIDDGKQQEYVQYLHKAQAEFLAAARLEPDSPIPHTELGIITAYEGDLKGSETAFRNALRLAMKDRYVRAGGTYYSNLAHISVYQGDLEKARRYLDKGTKTGAPQDEIDRISVLLAWKANDMVEARDVFNGAAVLSKQFSETWDGAPLPKKMETFDDFAATCCKNPTCGPYMEHACARERHAVARRDLEAETVRKQLELEAERRKQLKAIYDRNKGLDVQIEKDPTAPTTAPDAAPAPKAPPNAPAPTKPAPAKVPTQTTP